MLGALIFGPVADRFGRKPMIVTCTLFYGLICLATAKADSGTSLADPAIPRGPGFWRSDAQRHRADCGICSRAPPRHA